MPVTFDHNKQYNFAPAQTIENTVKTYANWAGIHDFHFDDLLQESSRALTFDVPHWYAGEVPLNMVLQYHTPALGHGAVLAKAQNGDYWEATLRADSHFVVRYYYQTTGLFYTMYDILVDDAPAEGDVVIAFREFRHSDDVKDIWHSISMWINDRLIASYTYNTTWSPIGPLACGLLATDTNKTLTDIRVPQLTEFAEWSSLDPGEAPLGGLNRALEGRYVKYFVRWNGALRAWRARQRPAVMTFAKDEMTGYQQSFDKRALRTHIRMMGAYTWAEAIRPDLIEKYGHRFAEANNPYLMTPLECKAQAEREIARSEEAAFSDSFTTPFTPLLEPEDHIVTPYGDRIIVSRAWRFTPGLVEQHLQARKYTSLGS